MRRSGLMTFQEALADNQRRAKRTEAVSAQLPPRSLADQRIDERNIVAARGIYFNLAYDKAKSHMNASPHLDELVALSFQESALRDAADMIASRIQVGLHKQIRTEKPRS